MKNPSPQKHFCEIKEDDGNGDVGNTTYLSLWYINEYVLKILGEPVTTSKRISQIQILWHTSISWVEFNIGNTPAQEDKWRTGSACNSETAAQAMMNYFLHLRDACGIKQGKKNYEWDSTKMRFTKVNIKDGYTRI